MNAGVLTRRIPGRNPAPARTPAPGRRRHGFGILALIAVFLVGQIGGWIERGLTTHPLAAVTGSGRVMAGVPVGYAQSPVGATQAAENYAVALADNRSRNSTTRLAMVQAIVAPAFQGETASKLQQDDVIYAAALDTAAGGTMAVRMAPLAYRLTAYTATAATVDVYLVGVLSRSNLGVERSFYGIESVSLVWATGDWKLTGLTVAAGPTPTSAVAGGDPNALLAGFTANTFAGQP
jgi:hypothetical protein